MNYGESVGMLDNKNSEETWDADLMILNAQSLQGVANLLERNRNSPQSDPVLMWGIGLAVPVLLGLATEIALKAWQSRERKGKPDRSHDLLKLFDNLEKPTRMQLGAALLRISLKVATDSA